MTAAQPNPSPLRAMAYKREVFKDKVEEHTSGALLEFYKARLASRNGQTTWVVHWETEVRTLLERTLVATLLHSIRGFTDRRRAAEEVFRAVQGNDASYRRAAENVIKRDYGVVKLRAKLTAADTAEFWTRVAAAVDAALA